MEDVAPVAPVTPRLVLIGTGHVFHIQDAIRDAILALRPEAVFVELDKGRLEALLQRRAGAPRGKQGNWLHKRLQDFQEGVAASYGTEAGGEMLAAVEGAHAVGARALLVDRPVEITLRRAVSELTVMERLRAGMMLVGGAFKRLLPRRPSTKDQVDAELARYQNDPEAALDDLGRQFPTVRRVVIDERDEWMAKRIRRGIAGLGLGIAVVGDGHIPGLHRRLAGQGIDVSTYRLKDVQAGRLPKPSPDDTGFVTFGFDVPTRP